MKERPILFNAQMVRALLDGTKMQTRRIVKITHKMPGLSACLAPPFGAPRPRVAAELCPYGQPGERMWVRETFRPIYPQDPTYNGGQPIAYDYAATYKKGDRLGDSLGITPKWKPSIHMARAASRIVLEIVSVRVERLQDVSDSDAIAEGIDCIGDNYGNGKAYCDYRAKNQEDPGEWLASPIDSYRTLWESINGVGSWSANPWVWVIEFRKLP